MKNLLFLAIAVLCGVTVHSQNPFEVKLSQPIEAKEMRKLLGVRGFHFSLFSAPSLNYTTTTFFDTVGRKAYQGVGFEGKDFKISQMDEYINFNGFKNLTAEFVSGKAQSVGLEGFITLNTRLYVLYTIRYKDADEFTLYVNEMSKDMVVLGTPIKVHSFKELKQRGASISISSSNNKAYFLVTRLLDTRGREQQKFECLALNNSFGEVWFKSFELEYMDKEVALQASTIDNAGNLYFMAEVGKKNSRKPFLYTYFWQNKSFKQLTLGLKEGTNFGFGLEIQNGVTPYLVGLNIIKKEMSYVFSKVNIQSQAIEIIGSKPLPDIFRKTADKGQYEPEDWNVTQVMTLANQDLVTVVEPPLFNYYRNGQLVSSFSYYAMLISFKSDGTLNWSHMIRKEQSAVMSAVLGTLVVAQGNKTLVIYNDDPSNLRKDPYEGGIDRYTMKKSMVMVQEIDPKGIVKKYPLALGPDLENYSINIEMTRMIKKGLYSVSFSNYGKLMNPLTKTATIRVK